MSAAAGQGVPEILVLAAGFATRFGADKRVAKISDQETLLARTVAQLQATRLPLTVCLASRASDDALAKVLMSTGVNVIRCARADEGMGSTLAEAVTRRSEASALIVALGDMPLLSATTVEAVRRCGSAGSIVVPTTPDGRRGHPVLFDRYYFAELGALSGDRGGASIIKKYAEHCIEVTVDDPGIHLDADAPEALEALCAQLASRRSSGVSG